MGKGTGIRFTGGDVEIALQRDFNGLITHGMEVGEVTALNQQRILASGRGEFRGSPLTGADIALFLNDDDKDALSREIVSQMSADGQNVVAVEIVGESIILRADYGEKSYK